MMERSRRVAAPFKADDTSIDGDCTVYEVNPGYTSPLSKTDRTSYVFVKAFIMEDVCLSADRCNPQPPWRASMSYGTLFGRRST
ncbi:hypothetical protein PM082_023527 [Marasmius tenuissimus]|nr:hypothetical protein PM082_023527 [Marasmius tenuissimus]